MAKKTAAKRKTAAKKAPAKKQKAARAKPAKQAPKKSAPKPKEKDPVRDNAGFYDWTGAMLLWGRTCDWSGSADELLACFDRLKLCDHEDYRVCPASDLSRFDEVRRRDSTVVTWVIGIKVATGMADNGPSDPITFERIRDVQRVSNELLDAAFWGRVDEALGDGGRVNGDADGHARTENIAVFVPFGPLAGGSVAFGKLVPRGTTAPEGLKLVQGVNMEQDGVEQAVLGMGVASGFDWDTAYVDFSDSAHAARTSAVGPDGAYFVVARYD
jgi:hypothetical protein